MAADKSVHARVVGKKEANTKLLGAKQQHLNHYQKQLLLMFLLVKAVVHGMHVGRRVWKSRKTYRRGGREPGR